MKKQVKVIRSADKTIVIYQEPPKEKPAVAAMRQRAIPVSYFGKRVMYIMPSGRTFPVREGMFWRIIKFIRPHAAFLV